MTLTATVTSGAVTVNEGTETFTLLNGTTPIGTAVTVSVVNGAASASYVLPAGTGAGSYTIQAAYSGTGSFLASSDNTHSLIISQAATDIAAANAAATVSAGSQAVAPDRGRDQCGRYGERGDRDLHDPEWHCGHRRTHHRERDERRRQRQLHVAGGHRGWLLCHPGRLHRNDQLRRRSDTAHTLTVAAPTTAATTTTASNASALFSASSQTVPLSASVTSQPARSTRGL